MVSIAGGINIRGTLRLNLENISSVCEMSTGQGVPAGLKPVGLSRLLQSAGCPDNLQFDVDSGSSLLFGLQVLTVVECVRRVMSIQYFTDSFGDIFPENGLIDKRINSKGQRFFFVNAGAEPGA